MTAIIGKDGIPFISSEELACAPLSEVDKLRRTTPVLRIHPSRVVALRAEDVEKLPSDERLVQIPGAQYCDVVGIAHGRCRAFLESFMLMTNGSDHLRRRGVFIKTFAHPVIRSKRAQVRAVADRVIADLPHGEPFDFLDVCSSRLPAEMIAEVLGLPADESSWFAKEVYSLSRCLMSPYDVEQHDEIELSAEALYGFIATALEERSKTPCDDLLSMLVTDETERALEREELIYQVIGVILGGSDTTRSGFNITVGRLLQDRALWDEVKADRALIPAAIDEALRIEPPVGSFPRYTMTPIDIGGVTIEAGQLVSLSTVSAMRDETRVANPEKFDLHREDRVRPHLVFGAGAHRCLGEMLARIELEEGLNALMDGAPDIEMIEAPQMMGFAGIRRSTPLIARIG